MKRNHTYSELGLIVGAVAGIYYGLATGNFYLGLSVATGVFIISTAIIRFIGKNFLVLAVIGYVLYQFIA